MQVVKALNNNTVVVKGENGTEKIVMGKGIGFGAKQGDCVDATLVEKTFSIQQQWQGKFEQLVASLPMQYILLSERAIQEATATLGKKLNDCIHITLTDHIASAIARYQEGIVLQNPLRWDIQRFYPDEYAAGLQVNTLVLAQTGVEFTVDEAAFIAMHFVNAEIGENVGTVYQMTRIIQEICSIVKSFFCIQFDEDSLAYYRFITHLKFLAQRLQTGQRYNGDVDDLFPVVQRKHPKAHQCALQVKRFLQINYDYSLGDEELLYLTVHIARISTQED